MDKTKYKRFRKALTTWLRADVDLVSLTEYTTSNRSIYVAARDEVAIVPCLRCTEVHQGGLIPDVDDGIYITQVICAAFAGTKLIALEIIGALEVLAEQNTETKKDASFNTDNIRTVGLRSLGLFPGVGELEVGQEDGVYAASLALEIRWMDNA